MSKQRALELCDEADSRLIQYTTDFNLGPLARSVQNCIDAIRELAKDEHCSVPDKRSEIAIEGLIGTVICQGMKQGAKWDQITEAVMLTLNNRKDLISFHYPEPLPDVPVQYGCPRPSVD